MTEVWKVGLQVHNESRRKHGLQDLKGDLEMHAESEKFAEYLASDKQFEPTPMGIYASNIHMSSKERPCDAIREAAKHFHETGKSLVFLHSGVRHMGIGVARNRRLNQWVVVVYYDIPGMREGHFTVNPNLSVRYESRC